MDEVKKLLKGHPNLSIEENEDGKCKVVCQLTSHEMPCTMKAVEMYINGKKYKYACEHKLTSKEQELCSQHLIERRRGQLYCKLTKRYLNNVPHHIRQHLNGRRFQKALNNNTVESTKFNTTQEKPEHEEEMKDDKDMWIPSDSESDSAEIEGLGLEFGEGKTAEHAKEDNYSFDVLNVEKTPLSEENDKETSNRKRGSKAKLKRSATASSEKSKKKGKKSQKNSNETPKKKKKRT
ncbi:Hypothetical predicted protein [Paramuricea clavata]|uniref:Uncharacterized protein n=1 Tax=Paramuricea clavata TaxID=317549 RepID=A0A6S7H4W5_PARCT|nr:Hypothetical predicted protein [Paramuricea clavata]